MMKDKLASLQGRMSLERTIMANHRSLLAVLRNSLYFLVAGLSVKNLIGLKDDNIIRTSLYSVSGAILVAGIILFFYYRRKCAGVRKFLGKDKSGIYRG